MPALTVSYAGFVNGDSPSSLTRLPTVSTTATAASHVAGNPYSITPSGAVDSDYSISYLPGALTVTPAPLTIAANSKVMVTGNPLPAFTATYTGLVNGDTPASLTSPPVLSTTATSQTLCGQFPINITGATDTDYTITQKPGTLWVITAVGRAIWVPVDPLNPTKSLLLVSGTAANDVIQINPGSTAGSVTVIFDGKSLGTFAPTSRICVYGGGGTDTISVSQKVTVAAWLYAENGSVQLQGGGGPTLLVGGPGKDTLWGGSGPTIMIGGSGASSLLAGTGDAILVGGTTAYDNNDRALLALLNTWSSAAGYATRVSQITSDPAYPLDTNTVFNDAVVDSLFGGAGMDLFFQSPGDNLQNHRSGETVIAIN
jgi:Ca2+-binding RTX toxin-like protein